MFTLVASLLIIAIVILMLVIFLLVALRPARKDEEPEVIARYTQHGVVVYGNLRKGVHRPNN